MTKTARVLVAIFAIGAILPLGACAKKEETETAAPNGAPPPIASHRKPGPVAAPPMPGSGSAPGGAAPPPGPPTK